MKLPKLSDMVDLVKDIKDEIQDDYRAFDEDAEPGIQLTVGWSTDGSWDYQTGDNSYSGGAYFHPHWAVVCVYRDSIPREVAKDIRSQLSELAYQ